MSDENDPNEEPQHIKDLRQKASETAAVRAENELLTKRMSFMEAGIDMTSKPAQALLAQYDGELTADAIKAEAADWGLAPASGDKTPPAPATGLDPNSPEMQHQTLAAGQEGSPAPTPEPPVKGGVDEALDNFKGNLTTMQRRDAEGVAFGDVIRAGMEGRPQATFDVDAWRAKQAAAGHGAEHAG